MFLVPDRQSTLTATVAPAEFAARLAAVTSPTQPWFRSLDGRYEFVGNVSPGGFQLRPVIRGQNTYLPRITGVVSATEIRVTQRLHPAAIVAVLLFFGVLVIASLVAHDIASAFFVVALLVAFHIVMYFTGFLPEARRVEARLHQLAGE